MEVGVAVVVVEVVVSLPNYRAPIITRPRRNLPFNGPNSDVETQWA